jgi:hypothetical protein
MAATSVYLFLVFGCGSAVQYQKTLQFWQKFSLLCHNTNSFMAEKICQGNDGQGNGKRSWLLYSPDHHSSDHAFYPIPLPVMPTFFGCGQPRRAFASVRLLPRKLSGLHVEILLPNGIDQGGALPFTVTARISSPTPGSSFRSAWAGHAGRCRAWRNAASLRSDSPIPPHPAGRWP